VHGLGDHSGRYGHVAQHLCEAGFALLALDLRGHGRSEGQRGHSPRFEALLDDIDCLLDEAATRWPGRPVCLYGHSLGGSLVLNYVLRRRPALAGVVATSPGLRPGFQPPAWKVGFGRIMYVAWPSLSLSNELDIEGLSRDPEVVRAYREDTWVHDRLSVRLGIDILETGEWALAHAAELHLPLLLMHGDADRLTSASASREFAARAGEGCTLKIWSGGYHELHNEPERAEVLTYLSDWLSAATTR
jgi:alpha-beta hydrolase superfamily lysophospholipase